MMESEGARLRLLFTVQPTVGHLHPLVPLARAATAAGHEVVVASGPALLPFIAGAGLQGWAAGLDEGIAEAMHPALRILRGAARRLLLATHLR